MDRSVAVRSASPSSITVGSSVYAAAGATLRFWVTGLVPLANRRGNTLGDCACAGSGTIVASGRVFELRGDADGDGDGDADRDARVDDGCGPPAGLDAITGRSLDAAADEDADDAG